MLLCIVWDALLEWDGAEMQVGFVCAGGMHTQHQAAPRFRSAIKIFAVVYLLPHESTYVEFLKVRNIQMEPATLTPSVPALPSSLQQLAESDR